MMAWLHRRLLWTRDQRRKAEAKGQPLYYLAVDSETFDGIVISGPLDPHSFRVVALTLALQAEGLPPGEAGEMAVAQADLYRDTEDWQPQKS